MSFDEVYQAPTPHGYFAEMNRLGYEIGEQAKPYFRAVVRQMSRELERNSKVRMLDLGCSYGVGSALVKFDFSFEEIAEFFNDAPKGFAPCVEATQERLESSPVPYPIECHGVDSSGQAIRFAREAGLLDAGFAKNLESNDQLSPSDIRQLRSCDLLVSTGAIGYVGPKTLSALLTHFGRDCVTSSGPCAVVTMLRMFDPKPIIETFEKYGYRFERVAGVRLRQRQFDGNKEFRETVNLIKERGISPEGWESDGHLYADTYAGALPENFEDLLNTLQSTHRELNDLESELETVS